MIVETNNTERSERDTQILKLRSEGRVYREIAEELGIGKATVNRVLSNTEVPEVLQEAFRQIAAMTPQVVENYREFLTGDEKTYKLAATRDVAKMAGLAPATTGSPVANTMNITQNIQVNINADTRALSAIDRLLGSPIRESQSASADNSATIPQDGNK